MNTCISMTDESIPYPGINPGSTHDLCHRITNTLEYESFVIRSNLSKQTIKSLGSSSASRTILVNLHLCEEVSIASAPVSNPGIKRWKYSFSHRQTSRGHEIFEPCRSTASLPCISNLQRDEVFTLFDVFTTQLTQFSNSRPRQQKQGQQHFIFVLRTCINMIVIGSQLHWRKVKSRHFIACRVISYTAIDEGYLFICNERFKQTLQNSEFRPDRGGPIPGFPFGNKADEIILIYILYRSSTEYLTKVINNLAVFIICFQVYWITLKTNLCSPILNKCVSRQPPEFKQWQLILSFRINSSDRNLTLKYFQRPFKESDTAVFEDLRKLSPVSLSAIQFYVMKVFDCCDCRLKEISVVEKQILFRCFNFTFDSPYMLIQHLRITRLQIPDLFFYLTTFAFLPGRNETFHDVWIDVEELFMAWQRMTLFCLAVNHLFIFREKRFVMIGA